MCCSHVTDTSLMETTGPVQPGYIPVGGDQPDHQPAQQYTDATAPHPRPTGAQDSDEPNQDQKLISTSIDPIFYTLCCLGWKKNKIYKKGVYAGVNISRKFKNSSGAIFSNT